MSTTIVFQGLLQRRKKLGMSRVELARRSGVHRHTVRNAEGGLPVFAETAEKIRIALENSNQPLRKAQFEHFQGQSIIVYGDGE